MAIESKLRNEDGEIANNWYIICLSRELKDKPLRRFLYDEPYVIYRDDQGKAVCLPDRCLHRHSTLSDGFVKKGCLSCSYHGWEYDSQGEVVHIPSEGPDSKPERKLRLKPVPCVEQDFAIWVWMGKGDVEPNEKPSWSFPNYTREGWVSYCMITDFQADVTDLVENFMDVPHTVYVHKGWFRDQKVLKNSMEVDVKDSRVLITYLQDKDEFSIGARLLLNPAGKPMTHTDEFIYPNITCVTYTFGPSEFIINSQCSPVSSLKSRVYTYIAYKIPFIGPLIKPIARFYTRKVITQDVDIMDVVAKNLSIDPQRKFHSTNADEVHKSIERLRAYGKRGDDQLHSFKSKKQIDFWI